MGKFNVYKTKKGSIVVLLLSKLNNKKGAQVVVYDHNIPPSKAKRIATFKAGSFHDYLRGMLPVLLKHLPEDSEVIELYSKITKEVSDGFLKK